MRTTTRTLSRLARRSPAGARRNGAQRRAASPDIQEMELPGEDRTDCLVIVLFASELSCGFDSVAALVHVRACACAALEAFFARWNQQQRQEEVVFARPSSWGLLLVVEESASHMQKMRISPWVVNARVACGDACTPGSIPACVWEAVAKARVA